MSKAIENKPFQTPQQHGDETKRENLQAPERRLIWSA